MHVAFVGIGSNLDDPLRQVERAIAEMPALECSELVSVSAVYQSEPVGKRDQPDFYNAVVKLRTSMGPEVLLDRLLDIEQRAGRKRLERWGPRVLDLDLLLHGDLLRTSVAPIIPHPRMHERAFVLVPLLEVAGDIMIPGHGNISDCLQRLGPQRLTRCDRFS
ncbi:MAG: 2-amino-4-hydroxy-6-hydroxymethyldihydropteridine diphosphokinase [Lysobacteraceae bacterium]